jgi:hypothetical protein
MSKKKRPRRSTVRGTLGFVRNLSAGDSNPVDRARRIAGNLMRRNWLGRRQVCCGNYGDPGC